MAGVVPFRSMLSRLIPTGRCRSVVLREQVSPPSRIPILVVDDEPGLRHLLRLILERDGYGVVEATHGGEALAHLQANPHLRIVLCDIRMPTMGGHAFLEALAEQIPAERGIRVVMMSAYGDSDTAVDCLSRGAFDYVSKPFRSREILASVERVVERERLEAENRRLRAEVEQTDRLGRFVGRSEAGRAVMALVRRAAEYPSTVLLTGESGTGKELLARAVHEHSTRASGPFVPINCAAIPESLLESELFGHERGAFTGAERARPGLFERADGGTLLLDEVGDMPFALQTRLLRVLEDGRVRRIGAREHRDVDVRVVAATAQDLEAAVQNGKFRDDLYYRLNVVRVRVPPLRERRSDIPLLAMTLVERASQRLGREVFSVSDEALALLTAHSWPGNVRELENVLERAVIVVPPKGRCIEVDHLSLDGGPVGRTPEVAPVVAGDVVSYGPDDGGTPLSIKLHSAELERHLITLALCRTEGHRGRAAALLEISGKALAYKIRDYGIQA